MKQVVFYGDSNTWGHIPGNGARFPIDKRFTGLLMERLPDCHICEEGICGRTAVAIDALAPLVRSGREALPIVLNSQSPIDLLVIMLGTNDVKPKFNLNPVEIGYGIEELLRIARSYLSWHGAPVSQILLVSPIEVGAGVEHTDMGGEFDQSAVERSKQLGAVIQNVAETWGCHFFDAATAAKPSTTDCVHLDEAGHKALADALEPVIREILK